MNTKMTLRGMPGAHRAETLTARYYNANGVQTAIVARAHRHGERGDWAAYIGSTTTALTQDETVDWVLRYGCKLSREDAAYYFPALAAAVPWRP